MLKKKIFGIMTLSVGLMLVMALTITFTACPNGTTSSGNTTCPPHNWGNWTITTQPQATTQGIEKRNCTKCNASETRNVAPLNWTNYTGNWVNTAGCARPSPFSVGNNTLTISANSINATFSNLGGSPSNPTGGSPATRSITNLTWTPMTNPNTMTDYSSINNLSGFKLEGTFGTSTQPMFVALMANGNLVLNLNANSTTGVQFIFTP